MQQKGRTYIAIDLKSFYASVECMERGLDPLTTNLVVADASRTEKTICLAVSPSLKAYGISGRARLFEVVERVKEVNAERRRKAGCLSEKSFNANELAADPSREVDYLIAPPRMAKYIQVSTQIYNVYLKYIAPEDIHVYSIDEVMMDVTNYLQTYRMTARELTKVMISDVLHTTGITATAGIGSNLYLCKVAMDIMAKHVQPDKDGVRIAELDEMSYREQLWAHRPLTDFWRVGRGYAKKLEAIGIYTMGDVARCSIGKPNEYYNEELLYRMFGINAELLIDHAWGWEPCRMQDIKAYRPETNSICSGQVLQCPYSFEKARLVVREMAEAVALDLLEKKLVTDQLTLTVGYDIENTAGGSYHGNICRSPMAEFVMKDLVKKAGLVSQFHIESAATSREEIGNPVYPPARRKLAEHGISCDGHAARQLTNQDYDKYDLLIGMDSANLRNIHRICGGDFAGKLRLLMDYTNHPCDVADPWYTGDFEATWQDVLAGCQGLLREITGHHHTRE